MKQITALISLLCIALMPLQANVTVSGPDDELTHYFAPKSETIELSGTAAVALTPTSVMILGFVEIDAKPFAESQQLAQERFAAMRRPLAGLTIETADTYQDPSTAMEIKKLKRLTFHVDFRIEVASLPEVDRVLRELATVPDVTINEIRPQYKPAPDLATRLLNAAMADLHKQKAFYEEAFGVELRLKYFSPVNGMETGGAAEEEVYELSPFSISTSQYLRYRQKRRAEEMVLTKAFQKNGISKRITAVYEIHLR